MKVEFELEALSYESCRTLYNSFNVTISRKQLCAGGEEKIDSCNGDSGGPIMIADSDSNGFSSTVYYLVGIVSHGPRKCGTKDWPGVYTRVSAYLDWILYHTQYSDGDFRHERMRHGHVYV